MFQNWFKENKSLIIVAGALSLCLVTGWILYALFGHQLIEAMYEGRSIGFLNRIIEGRAEHPVEFYFKKADELFYTKLQGIFILNLALFFVFILKCIYHKSSVRIQSIETGVLIGVFSILLSNYREYFIFNNGYAYTNSFINLSLSPFAGDNILQYRILIPLVGWVTGLRGKLFLILPTLGTLSFLAVANYWSRIFYKDKKTAVLITLLVAFLPVVQFTNVFCWVDIFCYLFLILALLNPIYCAIFILLGVLTHEFFFAYIPFIYMYHYYFNRDDIFLTRRKIKKQVLYLLSVLFVCLIIRIGISSFQKEGLEESLTIGYYIEVIKGYGFTYPLKQPLLLSFFAAYEMSWLLLFPFFTRLKTNWRKMHLDIFLLTTAFIPPAILMFIVHDTTRFWSNTFFLIFLLPMYISNETRNRWLIIIVIFNLLVPTFYFGYDWEAPLDKHAKIFKSLCLENKDIRTLTKSPHYYIP